MREEELADGWIPYRMVTDGGDEIKFRWLYAGDHLFTEPFFEESIAACLSLPQNAHGTFPLTSAETLIRVAAKVESIEATGIIYHISRCGSTLLSQILSCDSRNIVLSEVPLLDSILRMNPTADVRCSTELLFKAVLKLLSRKRSGIEQRVFVKTDSWHILFYNRLKTWYADVPSFLMHRVPAEVGASQAKHPAMHSVPGVIESSLFGLTEEETMHMSRSRYLDHVLTSYLCAYEKILQSDQHAYSLNYHDGVMIMSEQIFSGCNYYPDGYVRTAMLQRAKFHSKDAEKKFSGDDYHKSNREEFSMAEKKYTEFMQHVSGSQIKMNEAR